MPPVRPTVLCRSACLILEDALGNTALAISLAALRLEREVKGEARGLVVMIRRQAERLAEVHRGLTPCDKCTGCPRKGSIFDETA